MQKPLQQLMLALQSAEQQLLQQQGQHRSPSQRQRRLLLMRVAVISRCPWRYEQEQEQAWK